MFSFTPATRLASICRTVSAPACSICLKITRLARARRSPREPARSAGRSRRGRGCRRDWSAPRPTHRSKRHSASTHSIASATSQRWLASTAIAMSGPTASRASRIRRMSSSRFGADLELDLREALGDRLGQSRTQLGVVVPEPAGRRRVRRDNPARSRACLPLARGPARPAAQDLQRLVAGEGVRQVAEVDEVDDLLRRHLGQQLPQRYAGALGVEVPHGVDDSTDRHVHDALLRPQPAQLRVVHQPAPGRAQVGQQSHPRPAPRSWSPSASIAATWTSLPRPMVKTKP